MLRVRMRWAMSIGMAAVIVASYACSTPPAEQAPAEQEPEQQASAQQNEPTNDFPNPYEGAVLPLPDGRTWGSTAGVDIAPDGKHAWVIDRCGSNGCVGSDLDPILLYDGDGNFVRSFGAGKLAFPMASMSIRTGMSG